MSLRRGFKAHANRLSVRLRRSLSLPPEAPIDLDRVAQRLGIEIVGLRQFANECPEAVAQLTIRDEGAFSAATLQCGPTRRIIIHNDSHHPRRQRSNIAHEIAHILSGHRLGLPLDGSGCRQMDPDDEDEATWLGSVILITDEAAIHIVRMEMETRAACREYGVTEPILRMRINASGARMRVARSLH
jgi:hypothetical protein